MSMAGRYPQAWLDELRNRADIVQVVSAYVPLKKNGSRYWGLCPFHGEKTASFSVNPSMQLFYCFGCKAGGSVIQFIMDIERLEYHEAVKFLADQVHLQLPQLEYDPNWEKKRSQKERLLAANREAARYYHQTLFTEAGQPALDYLKGRGLSDSVIRKFGLGAAPDQWDALTQHLKGQGYTEEELSLAGLTVIREAEPATEDSPARPRRVFDMFRGRAIFPIIDVSGNVLAFGGRILGQGQPKYLNTSDTPVFNKREGVYAANLLHKERQLERVILVEGYMDVVSLTQFGVRGVCATLGTALTVEQARLLKRFAPKVFLAYDGDSAGQHAILRGLDILQAAGVPARVLDFPDGLDPDEFIRRDGPEGFAKLPDISPETYRMRRLREQYDMTSQEGRMEYARACARVLKGLDPVAIETHLAELSVQTGFSREVLLQQIGQSQPLQTVQQQPPRRPRPAPAPAAAAETVRAQELIISLIAAKQLPVDAAEEKDFDDPLLKSIYAALSEGAQVADIVERQATADDRARVSQVLTQELPQSVDESLLMARQCLKALRRQRMEKELQQIMARLNTAPREEQGRLMAEAAQLTASLNKLKNSR